MAANIFGLTELQQKTLFQIVRFWNKNGRLPRPSELMNKIGGISVPAAVKRFRRFERRKIIIGKGKQKRINESEFVTWKETAKVVMSINSGRVKKNDFIRSIIKDKTIKISDERKLITEILDRLIQNDYIKEDSLGMLSLGPTAANLSVYLKLLRKCKDN